MAKLSEKQRNAIPKLISMPTISEGIKAAGISRKTYYAWMKQPVFKDEIEKQRNVIQKAAILALEQGMMKAVEGLTSLCDSSDKTTKRLACKDVITFGFKYGENKRISERLAAIEEQLEKLAS